MRSLQHLFTLNFILHFCMNFNILFLVINFEYCLYQPQSKYLYELWDISGMYMYVNQLEI